MPHNPNNKNRIALSQQLLFDEDQLMEIEFSKEDSSDEDEREDIVSPFAPKDIKIIVEPRTIDHLVTRLRHNEIDLNTEFQRKGNLWKPDAQSRLIESILLRLPLPAFYFDAEDDEKWLVVDGLQRLWTIKNFILNDENSDKEKEDKEKEDVPLELNGLEILTDYNNKGVTFSKLGRTLQRRILETQITTYLIQPGTPKPVKYNVYRRINTGGLGLTSMEIRHALNQGRAAGFLRSLSEDSRLKAILKVPDKRMEDRELLLRAISFINKSYKDYEKPLSTFLDHAMEDLNSQSLNQLKELKENIIKAIFYQKELFGKHLFSRSILNHKIRVKLNSALFEVWVSIVSSLNDLQLSNLIKNKSLLIEDYKIALSSDTLYNSIALSTSGKGSVKIRFETIGNLISKYS